MDAQLAIRVLILARGPLPAADARYIGHPINASITQQNIQFHPNDKRGDRIE